MTQLLMAEVVEVTSATREPLLPNEQLVFHSDEVNYTMAIKRTSVYHDIYNQARCDYFDYCWEGTAEYHVSLHMTELAGPFFEKKIMSKEADVMIKLNSVEEVNGSNLQISVS